MKPEEPKKEPNQGSAKVAPSPVRGLPPGLGRRVKEATDKAKQAMKILK